MTVSYVNSTSIIGIYSKPITCDYSYSADFKTEIVINLHIERFLDAKTVFHDQ